MNAHEARRISFRESSRHHELYDAIQSCIIASARRNKFICEFVISKGIYPDKDIKEAIKQLQSCDEFIVNLLDEGNLSKIQVLW